MNGEYRHAQSVAIIGGADGPTSVFIAGKKAKMPLKVRIKNCIHRCKRKKAEKKIVPGVHTLEDVVDYATINYGATESDKKSSELPDTFHIYEIKTDGNSLEIEIDYKKDTFGVSFSGNKKAMKYFRKIAKDLYIYYGVSENDISNKTERYLSLLCVLSM